MSREFIQLSDKATYQQTLHAILHGNPNPKLLIENIVRAKLVSFDWKDFAHVLSSEEPHIHPFILQACGQFSMIIGLFQNNTVITADDVLAALRQLSGEDLSKGL